MSRHSPSYRPDTDKQAMHETTVITTMPVQTGQVLDRRSSAFPNAMPFWRHGREGRARYGGPLT